MDLDRPEKRGRNGADDLPDDLVVEILSRLPAKSVCRFKCVSRHWRDGLIAHPHHRAKLAQTLTGFFRRSGTCINNVGGDGTMWSPYVVSSDEDDDGDEEDGYESDLDTAWRRAPNFVSVIGKEVKQRVVVSDPALSFLPGYRSVIPKSSSNGLLLCLCWKVAPASESDYVVCNPATQQWVTVPGNGHRYRTPMRMFLAADSGHFHIFAILHDEYWEWYAEEIDIYSSEAGAWSRHESGWAWDAKVFHHGVFHRSMLHLVALNSTIVAVDTKGATWRTIPLLESMFTAHGYSSNGPFIGVSQEQLHYVSHRPKDLYTLSVWMLGDDDQWIFRYKISTTRIFGAKISDLEKYSLVGIHPECNTVFFGVRRHQKYVLLSYNMDRGKVRTLGNLRFSGWSFMPYLPYVPSFSRIAG